MNLEAPSRAVRNSASVVVPPIYGQDVKIGGSPAIARSFHFDGVFGPKATQENVYDKVVSPILHEVMQGYNCTIFAYGQTGTGKTYTMEGDLENGPSSVGSTPIASRIPKSTVEPTSAVGTDLLNSTRMSQQAGMIPRTLYNLFYALDKQSAEYYVRVSYVELYNEELRDLLVGTDTGGMAEDHTGMSRGGFEPMGGNLKVFDSGSDKGVVIQGLEEKIVTSAREAVGLLQQGAIRRKVASTRCNDASSRSHAIFTITVFIRERAVTVEGEDIVKLGKLNLVDLAGSENIGRSGAQDMRAREAGSINKSLLVLGRVITALVEKNNHVPYRESKLTYIIKDSLGGRTRTCMIATISTAADNMEETVKTLQYASQAKGIRNRPVANKKVSKSEIVHDMQLQMEQLRRDLDAARDGNGFYVTHESYAELTQQAHASKEIVDEWKQRVALWEDEVQRVQREHSELTRAHEATQRELAATSEALAATRSDLARTTNDLRQQTVLTRAHAYHEGALDSAATRLRGALGASTRDTTALHGKVARMGERERLNLQAVAQISEQVGKEAARVLAVVAEQRTRGDAQTQQLLLTLQKRVGEQFEKDVVAALQAHADDARNAMQNAASSAQEKQQAARERCDAAAGRSVALAEELRRAAEAAVAEGVAACAEFSKGIQSHSAQQTAALEAAAAGIRSQLDTCVAKASDVLRESQKRNVAVLDALQADVQALESRHAMDVEALQRSIQELGERGRAEDEQLVAAVQAAVAERREREQKALDALCEESSEQAQSHAAATAALAKQPRAVAAALEASGDTLRSALTAAQTDTGGQLEAFQTIGAQAAASLESMTQGHTEVIRNKLAALGTEAVGQAQQGIGAAAEESRQAADALCRSAADALALTQQRASAGMQAVQSTAEQALAEWRTARSSLVALAQTQSEEREDSARELGRGVSAIAEVVSRESEANVAATVPSGSTPPPRRMHVGIDSWNITRPHSFIVERLAADCSLLEDSAQLDWTGQPASERPVSPPMKEGDCPMAVSPGDRHAIATPPPSADAVVNGETPGFVEPSMPRKRSSENAASPASDAASQPPTRRPRIRSMRSSAELNGNMEESEASGIPVPAPSRLPAPRRSRRTRG
ncbi:Kinesin- motor protein [Coemansia guatemalensis]|uniref:Kinesin- motor protein n=1 Tax=Coemansia guatemalensis TaxID=2761395 RepID=A0A9W8HYA7_9FUNG|nr:Kinesin- motor protein [Coemansia guatemalensis]